MSEKTVERLSLYRRILQRLLSEGETHLFSHHLSNLSGGTAAQVRQDIRFIGYEGSPSKGYKIEDLIESINLFFHGEGCSNAVLVGIGNLGRALLAFFAGRTPSLQIIAAFDNDPDKTNRVIHGCRCFPVAEVPDKLSSSGACTGIITVPASAAQDAADLLIQGGVTGILNFAPRRIKAPAGIFIEHIDLTMAFEKVAYFANKQSTEKAENK